MDAEALKAWRQRMGYSQQEAAEALGSSLATIQSAETGRRPVAPMMALACCWLEHEAAPDQGGGDVPAQGDAPGLNDVLAVQQAVDDIVARLNRNDETINQWNALFKGQLAKLGERVQMLEMRPAPKAAMSESDIGMIARRAARSVLPE